VKLSERTAAIIPRAKRRRPDTILRASAAKAAAATGGAYRRIRGSRDQEQTGRTLRHRLSRATASIPTPWRAKAAPAEQTPRWRQPAALLGLAGGAVALIAIGSGRARLRSRTAERTEDSPTDGATPLADEALAIAPTSAADAEAGADAGAEADAEAEADAGADADAGAEADAGADAGAGAAAEAHGVSDAQANVDADDRAADQVSTPANAAPQPDGAPPS
jgi:hypothetical protein